MQRLTLLREPPATRGIKVAAGTGVPLSKPVPALIFRIRIMNEQDKTKLIIGKFSLWNDGERIIIIKDDGEGGGFDVKLFEESISKFYDEHF